jgi:hypothetical protein
MIAVLCEEWQSEALARLGGGFWEPSGREEDEASEEEDAWRADVEQELHALATVQVQEGGVRISFPPLRLFDHVQRSCC